jgi:hypothetical protein
MKVKPGVDEVELAGLVRYAYLMRRWRWDFSSYAVGPEL